MIPLLYYGTATGLFCKPVSMKSLIDHWNHPSTLPLFLLKKNKKKSLTAFWEASMIYRLCIYFVSFRSVCDLSLAPNTLDSHTETHHILIEKFRWWRTVHELIMLKTRWKVSLALCPLRSELKNTKSPKAIFKNILIFSFSQTLLDLLSERETHELQLNPCRRTDHRHILEWITQYFQKCNTETRMSEL